MAAVKIGLDFGTHYTKICVEDSSDKRNRRYLFHRFHDQNGNPCFVFPSVVQINKDNTLSYGFVDTDDAAMVVAVSKEKAPERPEMPVYRKYKQFPEPQKPEAPADSNQKKKKNTISAFSDLRQALDNRKQLEKEAWRRKVEMEIYEEAKAEYERKCIQRNKDIAQDKQEVDAFNEKLRDDYERRMRIWEDYEHREQEIIPATFRSFKQMVFSDGFEWRFDLDPMLVSIWYLCFVFFDLDAEYGTQNLIVSMGTSSGQKNWDINKRRATQIILTVYDLIENVFEHDKELFLAATLDELKSVTRIKEFTETAKEDNQIFVFPEAYANLNPLAMQKRFGTGVNAVVDIGGGTTDISIFVAPLGDEVKIFDYVSIPYGVNAIEKDGLDAHFKAVENRMDYFSMKIKHHAQSIGVKQSEATDIVTKRPVVFTGGGSMIPELRKPYMGFTDVIHMGSALLNNYSIDDALEVSNKIPMLSTALGLALCGSDDRRIPLISYRTLFAIVEEAYKGVSLEESMTYEHGVTDD